jgi:glucose-6-phosphate isomerase
MKQEMLELIKPFGVEVKGEEKNERLGWTKTVPFELIEKELKKFEQLTSGVENFVFSAMGGSINTVKALREIYDIKNIYTIDSLDPRAMAELDSLNNPIMISISKSGTTLETKTLAERWGKKIIWIKDADGDLNIQFDGGKDIGGRFSAPNTIIFWAPMYLAVNKNFDKLKEIYEQYENKRPEIEERMWKKGQELAEKNVQYFQLDCNQALETWATQLIEESLGSKIESYNPKTIVGGEQIQRFERIKLSDNVMEAMYEGQILVASIAVSKKITFVDQAGVENYKNIMKSGVSNIKIENKEANFDFNFVEVVNYGYMTSDERENLKKEYQVKYPEKIVLVFEGSDWNHHSYQAAYGNPETLFVLVDRKTDPILTDIAKATYETLKGRVELVFKS